MMSRDDNEGRKDNEVERKGGVAYVGLRSVVVSRYPLRAGHLHWVMVLKEIMSSDEPHTRLGCLSSDTPGAKDWLV